MASYGSALAWASFLLHMLAGSLCIASHHSSQPIIMQRPAASRVDFSEMLLEYAPEVAPSPNVSVDIFITLAAGIIESSGDRVQLQVILDEEWNDDRLAYNTGPPSTLLPSSVQPWQPDTVIVNALRAHLERETLSLSRAGRFTRRQQWHALLPLAPADHEENGSRNGTLVVGSFANAGATVITYSLQKAIVSSELEDGSSHLVDSDVTVNRTVEGTSTTVHDIRDRPFSRVHVPFALDFLMSTVDHFVQKLEQL